jgi:hypothetical protein
MHIRLSDERLRLSIPSLVFASCAVAAAMPAAAQTWTQTATASLNLPAATPVPTNLVDFDDTKSGTLTVSAITTLSLPEFNPANFPSADNLIGVRFIINNPGAVDFSVETDNNNSAYTATFSMQFSSTLTLATSLTGEDTTGSIANENPGDKNVAPCGTNCPNHDTYQGASEAYSPSPLSFYSADPRAYNGTGSYNVTVSLYGTLNAYGRIAQFGGAEYGDLDVTDSLSQMSVQVQYFSTSAPAPPSAAVLFGGFSAACGLVRRRRRCRAA